jgi:hypothetical protein
MNGALDLNHVFSEARIELFLAGGKRIDCRSVPIDLDEGSSIVDRSLFEVTRRGDLICLREHPPGFIRSSNDINTGFVSASSANQFRLCFFNGCTFSDSLELIGQFSFYPDQSRAEVFGGTWALPSLRVNRLSAINDLLRDVRVSQEIAIAEYFESSILVRQLGKDSGYWSALSERVLEFNRDMLGAKLSKSQIREYLEQFTRFRFFVVSSGA